MKQVRALRLNRNIRDSLISTIREHEVKGLEVQKQELSDKLTEVRKEIGLNLYSYVTSILPSSAYLTSTKEVKDKEYIPIDVKSSNNEDLLIVTTILVPTDMPQLCAGESYRSCARSYWRITGVDSDKLNALQKQINALVPLIRQKGEEIQDIVNGCNTTKQLAEAYPEWIELFPKHLLYSA